jgi:hypothetical protein
LINLQLIYNSHGGFDTYESEFTRLTDLLEEAGEPVTDTAKKTFFMQGIKDNSYNASKEVAKGKDFKGMVLHLRQKAAEIGKLGSTGKKGDTRKHNKKNNSQNKNNSQEGQNNNNKKKNYPDDGLSVPAETWRKMSSEAKRNWLKFRNEQRNSKPSAQKEYSKDTWQQNAVTTENSEIESAPSTNNN